jgi:hypothetical protein
MHQAVPEVVRMAAMANTTARQAANDDESLDGFHQHEDDAPNEMDGDTEQHDRLADFEQANFATLAAEPTVEDRPKPRRGCVHQRMACRGYSSQNS